MNIWGLLAASIVDQNEKPREILRQMLQEQIKRKQIFDVHKVHAEQTKQDYHKQFTQQPTHIKRPEKSHDHSSRHDSSRQYAGSRRR